MSQSNQSNDDSEQKPKLLREVNDGEEDGQIVIDMSSNTVDPASKVTIIDPLGVDRVDPPIIGGVTLQTPRTVSNPDVYHIPNFEIYNFNPVSDGVKELKDQAMKLSKKGRFLASLFKGLDVSGSIMILMLGAAISFVALSEGRMSSDDVKYVAGALGIAVTLIEGAKRVFNFSGRGTLFEQVANRAFYIAQRAQRLNSSGYSEDKIMQKIDEYYIKLGNLDMSLYDSTALSLYGAANSGIGRSSPVNTITTLTGLGQLPRTDGFGLGPPTRLPV